MSEILHINIDEIFSCWKSACIYKNDDGDCIEECSVGRIARWGAHYIAIIHDDVPAGEREKVAKFIANAPKRITELEAELELKNNALLEAAGWINNPVPAKKYRAIAKGEK